MFAHRTQKRALILFAIGALPACISNTQPTPEIPISERVLTDRTLAGRALGLFEKNWTMDRQPALEEYFQKLVRRLAQGSAVLKNMTFQITVADPLYGRWQSLGFAGKRLVLSREVLKRIQYENQLAAYIAFELANIQNRHLLKKYDRLEALKELPKAPSEVPTVILRLVTFSDDEYSQSVTSAISLMYQARYDTRGLNLLWQIYQEHPAEAPFSDRILSGLISRTRDEIVQYPPLIDPVVRTGEFVRIQKRLKAL